MSRKTVVLSVAALAVSALVAVGVTSASSEQKPRELNCYGLVENFLPIGFTEWPPHVGDRMIFAGRWYEWAGRKRGRQVGQSEFLVTATSDRGGWGTGTTFLPGGRIFFEGWDRFVLTAPDTYAVVGGTGRYAAAKGTLTVRHLSDHPPSFAVTLRLAP